jgi:hypothetical protein
VKLPIGIRPLDSGHHEWIRTKKSSFTLDGTSRTEKNTVSPTVDMITDALSIPDDSKIKIPPLYIHIPGTPVMTTENEHPGLKHVNGAEFTSVAVIPDARYPGYAISEGTTIHFGPPAGLLVTSEDIKDIQVPGLDRGTILITPKQTVISKKNDPTVCRRTGLTCVPAFAMTTYKSQSKTFSRILVDIPGPLNRTPSSRASTAYPSLKISRATTWAGLEVNQLMSKESFLACQLDDGMKKGLCKLECHAPKTLLDFERRCKDSENTKLRQWFDRWKIMKE